LEERQARIASVTEVQVMLLANALFDLRPDPPLALVGDIDGLETRRFDRLGLLTGLGTDMAGCLRDRLTCPASLPVISFGFQQSTVPGLHRPDQACL